MPKTPTDQPLIWRKQDWAYTNLRNWILTGELKPGQRIEQDALATDLGISRVPLRQALTRMLAEGLVEQQPHQRWVVAEMSLADARDVYSGRAALELLLTSTAATRINPDDIADLERILDAQREALAGTNLELARKHDRAFHDRINQVSGMGRTWQAQQHLRTMSDRYVAMFMSNIDRARASFLEHDQILDALRAGHAAEAGRLAESHVRGGIDLLETLVAE